MSNEPVSTILSAEKYLPDIDDQTHIKLGKVCAMKKTWRSLALAAVLFSLHGCTQPHTAGGNTSPNPGQAAVQKRPSFVTTAPVIEAKEGTRSAGSISQTTGSAFSPGNQQWSSNSSDPSPQDSEYLAAFMNPLSTFSADVDTASYSILRRSLMAGQLPQPENVRVEEMLNYFTYDLPEPDGDRPFSVTSEISNAPWNPEAQILRLAIKTQAIEAYERPPCNLVFLLDVSGSMGAPDKLPLLKKSLKTLVDSLDDTDRIAIVTYAGGSGLVLPSTSAAESAKILGVIDELAAGGSTYGASGLELAYQVAQESRSETTVNRVLLCTDGDFNVGPSSPDALKELIEQKRDTGLFLSVLGFGHNTNDKIMETLADNGNGNYASIDSLTEARKVLVEEAGATLVTVAKDVKFQVAFNPKLVERYRLIGYENRRLATEDFDNDTKDAGDLGAGHAVTALYEIIPPKSSVTNLGETFEKISGEKPGENQLAVVKLRYKAPNNDRSELLEVAVPSSVRELAKASTDHRWAVAVTEFGMHLSDRKAGEKRNLSDIYTLAEGAVGTNDDSYRLEFLQLVEAAQSISG